MGAERNDPPCASELPSGMVYWYRPNRSGLDELRPLLTAGEIRLSNSRRFNDPWDGRPCSMRGRMTRRSRSRS